MADDPLNVQHKILLEYEEKIRSNISEHLQLLQKQLGKVDKSFKFHHKGVRGTANVYKTFGKATSGAVAQMSGMRKVAFGLGKAFGKMSSTVLFATSVFKGLGAATITIIELSNAMVKFSAQAGIGSSAVTTLRDAYWEMSKASGSASISVRDLTESMSKFASIGFPQQMLAAEKGMQKAVGSMTDSLTKALGDPKAADALTQSLFKATSGDLPIQREFRDAILAAEGDINRISVAIRDVKFSQLDDAAFREAAGALDIFYEKSQGGVDGAVDAFTSWRDILNKLAAAVSNVGQIILKTFGNDIANVIDSVEKMFVSLISGMSEWGEKFKEWGAKLQEFGIIAKTHASNFIKVWDHAWDTLSGKGGDLKLLSIQEEIEKHYREQNRLLEDSKNKVGDVVKELDPMVVKMRELRDIIHGEILPDLESWGKTLGESAKLTASLANLTALVGSQYEIMGSQIGQVTREAAQSQIGFAKMLLDSASNEALATAQEIVLEYRKQVVLGDKSAGTAKALGAAEADLAAIVDRRTEAFEKINILQKQYVADLQADLTLTEKARQLGEARLAVTQAVYGTPALAVGAQLAIVKTMEQEKRLIEGMIIGEQQLVAEMEAHDIKGRELQVVQERLLDLQTQHTEKVRDQLNLVKELRDGYLSAVTAASFSAGRFSKILITQERNLMKGLEKGIAKRNYLLGQYGDDAGAANAQAMRFSASRLGLETMSGMEVTPEMARREQEARMAGAPNRQSAVGREANDIVMGIVSSADRNTLNNIETQIKQADRVVGAIDRLASSSVGLGVTKGLQGRPGETVLGDATRRAMAGLPANDFNVPGYVTQSNAQGTSQAAQRAMINFQKGKGKGKGTPVKAPRPPAPPTPGPAEFDVAAANKFHIEALVYYQKFLDALGKTGGRGGGGGAAAGGLSTGVGLALGGAAVGGGLALGGAGVGTGVAVGGVGGGAVGAATKAVALGGAKAMIGVGGGMILAAPFVVGAGIAHNRYEKNYKQLQKQQEIVNTQYEKSAEQLGNLSLKYKGEGEALRAERLRIEKIIASIEPGEYEESFFGGTRLTGEYTSGQKGQLKSYRAKHRDINAKIKTRDQVMGMIGGAKNLWQTGKGMFQNFGQAPPTMGLPEIGSSAPFSLTPKTSSPTSLMTNRGTASGNNMQAAMKIATQILMKMATGVDILGGDQNHITQYASGRDGSNFPAN